ncbi:MAG: hypothetical protein P1V97_37075 [Planctomycetota bacterium]|nr:hypothetical protein [Planctomycetota bacterium]
MKFCPKCGRGFLLGIYCVHDDAELIVNRCESCYREYNVEVLHCEDDGSPLPVFLQGPKIQSETDAPDSATDEKVEPDPSPSPIPSSDSDRSDADFFEPETTIAPVSTEIDSEAHTEPDSALSSSAFDAVEESEDLEEAETPELEAEPVDTSADEDEDPNKYLYDPKEGRTELIKTSAPPGEMKFGVVMSVIFGACTYWGFTYSADSDWADNFLCMFICPGTSALIALFLLFFAFYARGKATCPHCGEWVTGFVHGEEIKHAPELCDSCGQYCMGKGLWIWQVPTDFVASSPVFCAVLVDDFRVPDLCCECGGPATRKMGVDWTANEAKLVRVRSRDPEMLKVNAGSVSGEFMAPHCDRHHSGCNLGSSSEGPFLIYVQSHKFHQEFCKLNDTRPGKKD